MSKRILLFPLAIIILVNIYLILFGIPNFEVFNFFVPGHEMKQKELVANCRDAVNGVCPTIVLANCVEGLSPKEYLLSQNSRYAGVFGVDKDSDVFITKDEASDPKLLDEISVKANINFPGARFYAFHNYVFPGTDTIYYVKIDNNYCSLTSENLKKIFSPILNINDALTYISLKKIIDNNSAVVVKEKKENDNYYSFTLIQSKCAGNYDIKANVYKDGSIEETESFVVSPEVKSGMLQCD